MIVPHQSSSWMENVDVKHHLCLGEFSVKPWHDAVFFCTYVFVICLKHAHTHNFYLWLYIYIHPEPVCVYVSTQLKDTFQGIQYIYIAFACPLIFLHGWLSHQKWRCSMSIRMFDCQISDLCEFRRWLRIYPAKVIFQWNSPAKLLRQQITLSLSSPYHNKIHFQSNTPNKGPEYKQIHFETKIFKGGIQ